MVDHGGEGGAMAYQSATDQTEEKGERVATFPRKGWKGSPDTELRVSLDEHEGHPFISIRVWEQGRDRRWWPVKGKGCSVRVAEARGVAEALLEALAKLDVEPSREWTPPPRPAREPSGVERTRERRLPLRDDSPASRPLPARDSRLNPPWQPDGDQGEVEFDEFQPTR
jgi:hypothetical protein